MHARGGSGEDAEGGHAGGILTAAPVVLQPVRRGGGDREGAGVAGTGRGEDEVEVAGRRRRQVLHPGGGGRRAADTGPSRVAGIENAGLAGGEVLLIVAEGDGSGRRAAVGGVGGEPLRRAQVVLGGQRHRQVQELR